MSTRKATEALNIAMNVTPKFQPSLPPYLLVTPLSGLSHRSSLHLFLIPPVTFLHPSQVSTFQSSAPPLPCWQRQQGFPTCFATRKEKDLGTLALGSKGLDESIRKELRQQERRETERKNEMQVGTGSWKESDLSPGDTGTLVPGLDYRPAKQHLLRLRSSPSLVSTPWPRPCCST